MRGVRAADSFPRSAEWFFFKAALLCISLSLSPIFSRATPNEIYFAFLALPTHLHAGLGEVDFQRHFFAHEYIRVARFGKQRLQNVELRARKSSPLSSLLPRRR